MLQVQSGPALAVESHPDVSQDSRLFWYVPAVRLREGRGGFLCVLVTGVLFTFLALISGTAVYHSKSKGDEAIVAFVAASYLELVLLVCCIWLYRKTEPGSAMRNRLKASVWTLTTLLTFSFGYMVMGTAGLTLPVALLVWVIAAATGIGAFSAFFEQGSTALEGIQRHRDGGSFSCGIIAVLFGVFTLNSVMAVYHSMGNEAIVAFVATSYANLVLLFCCLWLYRSSVQGSPQRNRLKASVWTLTTLLTFSFAYIVMGTAGLTLPVALLVWIIAAATGIGAFSAFFEQAM
ncbi:hypothetical protein ACQ4PT_035475 [Festuca glaucescens]